MRSCASATYGPSCRPHPPPQDPQQHLRFPLHGNRYGSQEANAAGSELERIVGTSKCYNGSQELSMWSVPVPSLKSLWGPDTVASFPAQATADRLRTNGLSSERKSICEVKRWRATATSKRGLTRRHVTAAVLLTARIEPLGTNNSCGWEARPLRKMAIGLEPIDTKNFLAENPLGTNARLIFQ